MNKDNAFIVYANKRGIIKTIIGGVILLAIQIFLVIQKTDETITEEIKLLFLYIGIPLFSAGIIYFTYRLLVRKPVLVIDKSGILDQSSLLGVGMIEWSQIESIKPSKISNINFMSITLKDQDSLLKRLSPVKKFMLSMNIPMGNALINIPLQSFGLIFDDVVSKIKEYSDVGILSD